ncbi:MAG: 30S ribosomal protein S13 [Alphaproteobacteria bacterium]|nr:30S ribosomal protein S13 [Alphaproteobacteria bacterium]
MSRLFGVNLPGRKRLEIALQSVYGIGLCTAREICEKAQLDFGMKAEALTDESLAKIQSVITEDYVIEGDLRRTVSMNIKALKDMNCYRGVRHRRGLPVRGQRTHSNARMRKGRGLPVAGKKKV